MSKQSRNHLSRSQLKRRHQLNEQTRRSESRESQNSQEPFFAPWAFLKNRIVELLVIVLIVVGVMIVRMFSPDSEEAERIRESVSSLLVDETYEWMSRYPYGYKIIAITEENIIHTSHDTLPEELTIDWKNLIIARIEANQLTSTFEKIKVQMTGINYTPANVSEQSITTTLSSHHGSRTNLAKFGNMNFIIEIIEGQERQMFCLLGLN